MSAHLSAPHSPAASAITRTSSRSCRELAARGSGTPRKAALNLPMRLPLRLGSRSQNPSCAPAQYLPQIHMRFPWLAGEGWGEGLLAQILMHALSLALSRKRERGRAVRVA